MKIHEFIQAIELQRFKMGMGVVDFAKYLGLHYHTYHSFRKKRRITQPRTLKILLEFGQSKGINVNTLEFE